MLFLHQRQQELFTKSQGEAGGKITQKLLFLWLKILQWKDSEVSFEYSKI